MLPVLFAVLALTFVIRNLPWHLDDYDQAKQAYVSFEMVQDGQWWFQHTPAGHIATKPPFVGWISAGLALASGGHFWELAWRLPPLGAGLLILWLLMKAGRELGGDAGALLAGAAFGLNTTAPRLASMVRTDMVLCLTIFLAGYTIYQKLRTNRPWTARERWTIFLVLLASFLTKGPIAYAFLLPGLAAFWWLERRSPDRGQAWSGWWSWLAPLLFFAVWAGLGIYLSQDFYQQVVLREFLGRFETGEGAPHKSFPVYFYLTRGLGSYFPWSLVLLALLFVREFRDRVRREPALLWLVCWAVGGLVFMSLIPSKRADRIFPVVPPFCLLIASSVPLLASSSWRPTCRLILTVTCAALLSSGSYLAYNVVTDYRSDQGGLKRFGTTARQMVAGRPLMAISGKDEGMLLYLGLTHFTRPDDTYAAWQDGTLQACVLPEREYAKAERPWPPARVVLRSGVIPEKFSGYLLIMR